MKDDLESVLFREPMDDVSRSGHKTSILVHACFDFFVGLCVGVGDIITHTSEATQQQTRLECGKGTLKFIALSIWHSQYYHTSVFFVITIVDMLCFLHSKVFPHLFEHLQGSNM